MEEARSGGPLRVSARAAVARRGQAPGHVRRHSERALEADVSGEESFVIAAADTVMKRPSRELMAEVFPSVPIRGELAEHGSLLAIDKARRLFGYDPQFTWRELF